MTIRSLLQSFGLASLLTLSASPLLAQTQRPLAIFLQGHNSPEMPELQGQLRRLNAEIWQSSPGEVTTEHGEVLSLQVRSSDQPDTLKTLKQIPGDRPLVLIGEGLGANAVFALLPLLNRSVDFVALVNPPQDKPLSHSNAFTRPHQVGMFLSYFNVVDTSRKNSAFDRDTCNAATNCYQFAAKPQSGDRHPNAWIQDDIAANLTQLLFPRPASPE